ncbi:hypothetical protein N9Q31_02535 [Pseudomonadales bacterium]|nr:hypothetical protein [Pseudomonadales bacterium]
MGPLMGPLMGPPMGPFPKHLEQTSATYQALAQAGRLTIFKQLKPDARARATKLLQCRDRRRKPTHDNSTAIQAKSCWLLYTDGSTAHGFAPTQCRMAASFTALDSDRAQPPHRVDITHGYRKPRSTGPC